MILNASKASGGIGSKKQEEIYLAKLKSDSSFRNDEWERLKRIGKLQERKITDGTKLFSNRFSFQYLTKTATGYTREFETGRVESFNAAGKLAKIGDKNGNFIEMSYGKDGKLTKISDNFNRRIFIAFNNKGFVESLQGEGGKSAQYKYNDDAELIESKDTVGNTYGYKYSSDKRHNLIEIGYSDKKKMSISYYGRDKNENVKSVKETDGGLTEYSYDNDSKDKGHFTVGAVTKGPDGNKVSESQYQYFMKRKADGEEWNQKLISVIDGDRTETEYHEQFGAPVLIKRGTDVTEFKYDAKGRVTYKATPSEITELSYDPKAAKVSKAVRKAKSGSKKVKVSEYQYDQKFNLVYAKDSDGKGVQLVYDLNGRIKSMIVKTQGDKKLRTVEFKYNEQSKPIEITDRSIGTIKVSYKPSGEIAKVDSSGGKEVAAKVTQAFQSLLDVIKPAGVTLSF
jgi:hypothetical protein